MDSGVDEFGMESELFSPVGGLFGQLGTLWFHQNKNKKKLKKILNYFSKKLPIMSNFYQFQFFLSILFCFYNLLNFYATVSKKSCISIKRILK